MVQLTLTDNDNELPETLMYHIRDGDIHSKFAVRSTGEVYVANSLDRETLDRYQLTVLVTDGKYVSTAQLFITVTDINGITIYFILIKFFFKNRHFFFHCLLIIR